MGEVPHHRDRRARLSFSNIWIIFAKHGEPFPCPSDEENTVKLMSAHAAKGLEFDHVFILRAVNGTFPCDYREPLIEIPTELRNSGLARRRREGRL